MSSLLELPIEIVAFLTQFLDPRTYIAFGFTCKTIHNLINDPRIKAKLLKNFGLLPLKELSYSLKEIASSPAVHKSVKFSTCMGNKRLDSKVEVKDSLQLPERSIFNLSLSFKEILVPPETGVWSKQVFSKVTFPDEKIIISYTSVQDLLKTKSILLAPSLELVPSNRVAPVLPVNWTYAPGGRTGIGKYELTIQLLVPVEDKTAEFVSLPETEMEIIPKQIEKFKILNEINCTTLVSPLVWGC